MRLFSFFGTNVCWLSYLLNSSTEANFDSSLQPHPAKFKETVENCIGKPIEIPAGLQAFMQGEKQAYPLSNDFNLFKKALINLS